jgi:hypothetical protein
MASRLPGLGEKVLRQPRTKTIGRHAVQHIEYGLFGHAFGFSISYEQRQSRRRAAEAAARDRFRACVVALMAAGYHRDGWISATSSVTY